MATQIQRDTIRHYRSALAASASPVLGAHTTPSLDSRLGFGGYLSTLFLWLPKFPLPPRLQGGVIFQKGQQREQTAWRSRKRADSAEVRRWPHSPELREQGEPGFLGNSASVLGFPSSLVSTHSAPIASASVPLILHRTLTLRSGPPTQGCHNPVSNKPPNSVPALSCSIQRVRTAEKPQGGAH